MATKTYNNIDDRHFLHKLKPSYNRGRTARKERFSAKPARSIDLDLSMTTTSAVIGGHTVILVQHIVIQLDENFCIFTAKRLLSWAMRECNLYLMIGFIQLVSALSACLL